MLAIISDREIDKEAILYHLLNSPKSILKQSAYNEKRLQKDGWGIGFFSGEKAKIFKSPNAVYDEQNLLRDKSLKANSKIFIVHVRNASNPRKLPHKELISYYNTQPFSAGNIIFAHNGTLSIVDEIYSNLGSYSKYVRGVNDSEILFWNFIKHLDSYGDIKKALIMVRDEINTVWVSVRKDYSDINTPYKGLNIFVSDGKSFYALCDFAMKKEIYSIMTPGWEYGKMALKRENKMVIISSEPTDNSKWTKIDNLSVIEVNNLSIKLSKVG
ncbi:MAG: class II glutamine amidotransferase [Elusimicrobiota bacterium]